MNNFEYNNSANYFNYYAYEDYSEFYMIQYVRPGNCIQEMVNEGIKCVEIDYDVLDEDTGFIVFSRVYLNPCTGTGPSKEQFLHETILEFDHDHKKKSNNHHKAENFVGYMDQETMEIMNENESSYGTTLIMQVLIIFICNCANYY